MEKFMIKATNGRRQEFFGPYDTEAKAQEQAKVLTDLGRKTPKVQVIYTCSTVGDLVREAKEAELAAATEAG